MLVRRTRRSRAARGMPHTGSTLGIGVWVSSSRTRAASAANDTDVDSCMALTVSSGCVRRSVVNSTSSVTSLEIGVTDTQLLDGPAVGLIVDADHRLDVVLKICRPDPSCPGTIGPS